MKIGAGDISGVIMTEGAGAGSAVAEFRREPLAMISLASLSNTTHYQNGQLLSKELFKVNPANWTVSQSGNPTDPRRNWLLKHSLHVLPLLDPLPQLH